MNDDLNGVVKFLEELKQPYAIVSAVVAGFVFVGGLFDPARPEEMAARVFFLLVFAFILFLLVRIYAAPYETTLGKLVGATFAGFAIVILVNVFAMTLLDVSSGVTGFRGWHANDTFLSGMLIATVGLVVFRVSKSVIGMVAGLGILGMGEVIMWVIRSAYLPS